jgi:hypothetical protein
MNIVILNKRSESKDLRLRCPIASASAFAVAFLVVIPQRSGGICFCLCRIRERPPHNPV